MVGQSDLRIQTSGARAHPWHVLSAILENH